MKPNHLFTSLLGVTALLVASCSTPRVAQNAATQDDVYNTTAQAKVYKATVIDQTVPADTSSGRDYYGKTDPRYDMDYASRIDRFYYGTPYRGYYDPIYNYYGYNSYYGNWGYGYGYGLGFDFYPFYTGWGGYWGYYGGPYFNSYWGPYSAYNYYGAGYYGGFLGGGYYGGGYYAGRGTYNGNYGPRPRRGSENGGGRASGTYNGGSGVTGAPGRSNGGGSGNVGMGRSRAENYNPNPVSNTSGGSGRSTTDAGRPTRSTGSTYTPPSRPESTPSRPSYSPPPSSSGSSGSSGGGSSSGGGGGGGGGRPTRGGGR